MVGGEGILRTKIRRILNEKPALKVMIEKARTIADDQVTFAVDHDRVRNVILKLARGHAVFELNEPQLEEPAVVAFVPLLTMSDDACRDFEASPAGDGLVGWPEVGSRAMVRLVESADYDGWVTVQPGRYRYSACIGPGVVIRIVVGEYLACEVIWE